MNWDSLITEVLAAIGVIVLVLLNGLFVAAELALVRIRDTQLGPLASRGNRRAQAARHVVARIDAYIGATQFGITLVSMALGAVVQPVFRRLLEPLFYLINLKSVHAQGTVALLVGFFINC